ncbi:hypothetical protein [Pseudobacter ginsenosidimutans]|uniref:Uncharacterized protein n=1 Tax=Pseudobacter ginsenosidimutans TaxID=661488 RepID=A0A4Q7N561_9BACT|nr:hypothetical protein [Pseudobacter ginsenosidimutans]QEC44680.1 hypothetical protein FSB84_24465 [Pseudobacter ginsenosidimutans]RZS76161.1 hypothetical protein EV199_2040 [Pseudobacter ginsenosidimutans]
MKHTIFFLSIFLLSITSAFTQSVPVPPNYTVIDSIFGDLDRDGIYELVASYTTHQTKDFNDNYIRELIIYKKKNKQWTVWKQSSQALTASKDGGMMSDPYAGIEIKNGILIISEDGGSSWKWARTDKYRYQDGEFYLIGYSEHYGKICEYWMDIDFNLLTGQCIVKKEYESCEDGKQEVYKNRNETFIKKGIKITMQQRKENEIMITSPKYKHELHISTNQ